MNNNSTFDWKNDKNSSVYRKRIKHKSKYSLNKFEDSIQKVQEVFKTTARRKNSSKIRSRNQTYTKL